MEGVAYLFEPDFSKLSTAGVLSAMGQAFFSLSLGMGAIMIYGSYLRTDASIGRNSVIIAGMDTLVALLSGLAIFPVVFAYGLEPQLGSGMVFKVLPQTLQYWHISGAPAPASPSPLTLLATILFQMVAPVKFI